ncbi:MAG: DUF3082 domain-containing protein [Waterburya sp.]
MKENTSTEPLSNSDITPDTQEDQVTPLKCFFSSIVSGGFAYAIYLLFNSIVQTYAAKTVTGTNPLVINITAAVRTLVMGVVALATGVFALVAVGLFLLGIQLTIQSFKKSGVTKSENK